jgi:hypothetical protein
LGIFKTEKKAARAYDKRARELGRKLNCPGDEEEEGEEEPRG